MYKITKIEQKILKLGIINENIKGKINEKNAFLCFMFLFFIWFQVKDCIVYYKYIDVSQIYFKLWLIERYVGCSSQKNTYRKTASKFYLNDAAKTSIYLSQFLNTKKQS